MTEPTVARQNQTPRLQSIDALRGFDMFWIIRGDTLARSLATWLGFPAIALQFEHVKWDGFRFYDLIFPLFLFLVGCVLPFSLSKYTDASLKATDFGSAYFRIARRALLLILLGLIYNGLLKLNFEDFRWPGVLQRIGICYFFTALAVLHLRTRGQSLLFVGILVGYWCLLLFVPAPSFGQPDRTESESAPKAYDLTKEGSLVGYVDRQVLPGRLFYKYGDNEGVLSTLPAIATTLLGALAGQLLRSTQTAAIKVLMLYLSAAVCLAAGYSWSLSFPLNKILWTSSFVLVTGGYSLALLATFYWVIDVMGFRRWAFFFVVIGMNAITIYVMQQFIDFTKISEFFLSGAIRLWGMALEGSYGSEQVEAAQKALLMLGVLTAKWLFLWYLYRKKTFLRV